MLFSWFSSGMSRVLLVLVAILALSAGVLGWRVSVGQSKIVALQGALQAKSEEVAKLTAEGEANKLAAEAYTRVLEAINAKEAQKRVVITKVLANSPDWSNQRIPDAIANGLHED
jgi:hypothetical protein